MAVETDNLVSDFIINTRMVLEDNRSALGIKKVYDEDVALVEITPSISVSVLNIVLERRTLGSIDARFEVDLVGELWYYHEIMNKDTRRNEVMRSAWEVCHVLQTNATLNQWLKSTRAYIRACTWAIRRNSNLILASARIILVARKQERYTIV